MVELTLFLVPYIENYKLPETSQLSEKESTKRTLDDNYLAVTYM